MNMHIPICFLYYDRMSDCLAEVQDNRCPLCREDIAILYMVELYCKKIILVETFEEF